MDTPALLAKIAGTLLLGWTAYSIAKHVRQQRRMLQDETREAQSISERILNNILLYLWLAFMTVFSIGMIVNN